MDRLKYSRRVNLTLPIKLLKQVDEQAKRFNNPRNAIIRWALQDWLEAHPDPVLAMTDDGIDPNKPFNDYIKPDMDEGELLDLLARYEKAQRNRL